MGITIKQYRERNTRKELRQEKEANLFARCLLMPEEIFREYVDGLPLNEPDKIKKIIKTFQVPHEQVIVRLVELGYEVG